MCSRDPPNLCTRKEYSRIPGLSNGIEICPKASRYRALNL